MTNREIQITAWVGRAALSLLLGLLAYLAVELRADTRDHERRLTAVEVNIEYIKQGIDDLKHAMKPLPIP